MVKFVFDKISDEEFDIHKTQKGVISFKVKRHCAGCEFFIDRYLSPKIHFEILEPSVAELPTLRRTYDR